MKNRSGFLLSVLTLALLGSCEMNDSLVQSPDGKLQAELLLEDGRPFYTVRLGDRTILKKSPLGLVRGDGDFSQNLKITDVTKAEQVTDDYTMPHGKQSRINYKATRRIWTLENPQKQKMKVIFQVSNDGIGFRYRFPDSGTPRQVTLKKELTGFAFPEGTLSWLHPLHDSKTGWQNTYPSYESHYEIEKPVGRPAPFAAGWAFPALFRVGDGGWVLLSETAVYSDYCGSRLAQNSDGGIYSIAFPQENEHRGPQDPISPSSTLPWETPWRLVIVARDLGTIVESTLATDLAEPSKVEDPLFIKPGRAAWSWLRYDTGGTELPKLREYLDMADHLEWEYMLVDADWDRIVGYEKIADLVKEAKNKGVELILWYNSNGDWNNAPMTPKNRVHIPEVRCQEFKRISDMGIKGIKVDFFGGDKQATMQLYMDILEDAARFHLLANFHGATLPRGWQRTWPNMVTTEAVMGMEYCTFDQQNTDREPQHSCVLPFTRNVVAPMDFTPLVMSRRIRNVRRVTTQAFELALPVVFESGIQHFGLAPFEAAQLPDFARDYLKKIPAAWDQTHFVSGYPAKDVVLARRKGTMWFVAGINGEKKEKNLTLDLSFLEGVLSGTLIMDSSEADKLETKKIEDLSGKTIEIELQPQGGFVLLIP